MAIICAIIAAIVAIIIWCVPIGGRCVHLRIVRTAIGTVVLIEMTANPMRIIVIVISVRMDAAIRLMVHTIGVVVVGRWHCRRHSTTIMHISIVVVMVMMVER